MSDIDVIVKALDQDAGAEVRTTSISTTCLWCGKAFAPRRGGSPKRFCSATHRMAFWSALRRWGERAVASGALTVDHIKNADPAACTLLPGGVSALPVHRGDNSAPVAPPASSEDAAELLDDLLITLLELPGDGWFRVVDMLSAELVDKICDRIEASTG